jgi:dolichol kinase
MNSFFIIMAAAFLVLFVSVEIVQRIFRLQSEYTRKIAHVGSGFLVYFFPLVLSRNEIIVLALVFLVFLSITKMSGFLSSIHRVDRKTLGELFFPLGIAVSAFLFVPNNSVAFQFGALVLGLSDAAGGLIGTFFGKHKIAFFGKKKSWEGSAAFFCTTLIVGLGLMKGNSSLYSMVLVAAVLTVIELMLTFGVDNLLIPIVSGLLFQAFFGM